MSNKIDVWEERIFRIKKWGAISMLFFNLFLGVVSLGFSIPFGLLFFGAFFIIFDYYWKFYKRKSELPKIKKKWWQH